MRAPVRKKLLRGGGRERPRRRARRRQAVSIAVVGAAVLAAGGPLITSGGQRVADAQRRADHARTARAAILLAHSLADERDAVTAYVAAGRDGSAAAPPTKEERSRVDRRVAELREDVTAEVRRSLDGAPAVRQRALHGGGTARDTFDAYSETVRALGDLAEDVSPDVMGALGRAVEEAAATRGLLLASLVADGSADSLGAAARRSRTVEQAALADFERTAPAAARDGYRRTVNGERVRTAERYLEKVAGATDGRPRGGDREDVETSLTARITLMRGVRSSLASTEVERLDGERDDQVTALELRVGLVAGCLLLALAVSLSAARATNRPLAAVRLGARRVADDPVGEEALPADGRDDAYADLARSVNQLQTFAVAQAARVTELDADRVELLREHERRGEEQSRLSAESDALRVRLEAATSRLEEQRGQLHGRFVSLGLRSLNLVQRQLAVIESLEQREADPDRLETLFTLDHLATGIRRHGENLLVIAGAEHKVSHPGPVPLLDVLRAAISEVERYERVRVHALPPQSYVSGHAADSISHLVAELLDNATAFSPPDSRVRLSGRRLETGEVVLTVQDEGIGMAPERFEELNRLLAVGTEETSRSDGDDPLGLGLYVVTRLAATHGVQVELRQRRRGGVAALVALPTDILLHDDETAAPAGTTPAPDVFPSADTPGSRRPVADPPPAADPPPVAASEQTMRLAAVVEPDRADQPPPWNARGHDPAGAAPAVGAPVPTPAPTAEHSRADQSDNAVPPSPAGAPPTAEVTATGLPKRAPKAPAAKAAPARKRSGGVDPEVLRRRLGGFQQGAREGRRDAEVEFSTGQFLRPTDRGPRPASAQRDAAGVPDHPRPDVAASEREPAARERTVAAGHEEQRSYGGQHSSDQVPGRSATPGEGDSSEEARR